MKSWRILGLSLKTNIFRAVFKSMVLVWDNPSFGSRTFLGPQVKTKTKPFSYMYYKFIVANNSFNFTLINGETLCLYLKIIIWYISISRLDHSPIFMTKVLEIFGQITTLHKGITRKGKSSICHILLHT